MLRAQRIAEVGVRGCHVRLQPRCRPKTTGRFVELSLLLQGQAEVVQQHRMLHAGGERDAISTDRGGILAPPAFEVADSEVRFGIVRGERNGLLPRGERPFGLESLEAEAEQRPRLCVAGRGLDGALGAHDGCLALAAHELGARQLLVRRARHQLGSPPFQP